MILNQHSKEFILQFFENKNYAGWKNIADILIQKGKCTVAGNECIWKGGIGNFINTSPTPNAFNCLDYTFNLKEFTKSRLFQDTLELIITDVEKEKNAIQNKLDHLKDLKL